MDANDIARRARVLPDHFASRLPERRVASLRLIAAGGEHGELVIELAAALAASGAPVSTEELQELRLLLEATGKPTDPVDQMQAGR